MKRSDYESHDGLGLAALLKSKQVSALELMRSAIAQAEAKNPPFNALCYVKTDEALELAASAAERGSFGALPFLLKDSGLASTFLESSIGSRLFAGTRFPGDATLTRRFVADGFLPFGRTTVPEFCMAPTTEAVANGGPTRNPWDRSRSAGGSSGGAAVAVATGIVPIAHGSDGGGSIRIPAACCGIFGLKPSRGLVPIGPYRGEAWGGLAVDGVLTRTVRDTAAALDGIAGMELGAPYAAPAIPGRYLEQLHGRPDRGLRIARWSTAFDDIPVAPECVSAVDHAARLLAALGHDIVDAPLPPIRYGSFLKAHQDVLAASVRLSVNGKVHHDQNSDWESRLEPAMRDAYHLASTLSAEDYALAITRFHTVGRQLAVYMTDYDYILTPTLTQLPARLGMLTMDDEFRSFRNKVAQYTTFLAIINASGQPAASLPLYWTADGLPVGVQLIGRFGDDAGLLGLSAQLEEAAPWRGRRPPV